ncbi:MAG: FAD-dependent oxidoreductase [Myxococcales bacterium]|nr:FAD-dependent oxidoreductase [Myxococcales bacterium]
MDTTHPLDVLVIGGGSAGAATAAFLARQGRSVCVIERRAQGGARWVNGVPAWCFHRAKIALPTGPEHTNPFGAHSFVVAMPDGSASVRVENSPTLHVDMRYLIARLREMAKTAGCEFVRGRVIAISGLDDRNHTVEVLVNDDRTIFKPKLIVDASGISFVSRKLVPTVAQYCAPVGDDDICAAAQYQCLVIDKSRARSFLATHGASPGDSLALTAVAGGYSVITLFTDPEMNHVGVLTGSIPATGAPTGATMLDRFVRSQPWIGGRHFGGQGAIPLRRPQTHIGLPGLAIVGDAACQVYSAHGSGVGMGLVAARLLADAAEGCLDPGTQEVTQRYSSTFLAMYGGLLTGSDIFRRFSQSLGPNEIRKLMSAGLLNPELMRAALNQEHPPVDRRTALRTLRGAIREPRLASRLLPVLAKIATAQSFYRMLGQPSSTTELNKLEARVAKLLF